MEHRDLATLLDAGDGAVVTLVAGDTQLAAHKAVLATRSPVFAAIFGHDTLEASGGRVSITDVEGPVLRHLLSYLYTLQSPQLPNNALELMAAADKYGVLGLKADCELQAVAQLSVENAATAAVLAVRHTAKRLKQAAVAFIKANFLPVVATRGWSEAMRGQPEEFSEVVRLLTEASTETSTAVAADSRTTPATELHSRTPATTTTTTAAPTPTTESAAVSRLRSLSAEEKGRRLIQAAEEGAVEKLRALLTAGADVEARDENRKTALHWAAQKGHVEVARLLLRNGAEVDARDNRQSTPLLWAAYNGHAAVVRLLLASSADSNARNVDSTTPLLSAASRGHTALVRLLLDASAFHSARNIHGWTPLHYAAEGGHTETAAALLEAGADRAARTNDCVTPLDIARQKNNQQLVDALS